MKRCCICHKALSVKTDVTTVSCAACTSVWKILYGGVDDAVRYSIPAETGVPVLERALAVEMGRVSPRRTMVQAFTRRITEIKKGAKRVCAICHVPISSTASPEDSCCQNTRVLRIVWDSEKDAIHHAIRTESDSDVLVKCIAYELASPLPRRALIAAIKRRLMALKGGAR